MSQHLITGRWYLICRRVLSACVSNQVFFEALATVSQDSSESGLNERNATLSILKMSNENIIDYGK